MRISRRYGPDRGLRRGFTLIELLVVIAIIGIVSAIGLTVVSHGSTATAAAARSLQAALVGARDAAIATGRPHGIRLLLDPAFPISRLSDGSIDPSKPLCANRIIPIEVAPDYSEGLVVGWGANYESYRRGFPGKLPWSSSEVYPYPDRLLMIQECSVDLATSVMRPPTSWFWNIRVGDRIQIGGVGTWYTVVGPMTTPNPEMFVNCGKPGVDFTGVRSPLVLFLAESMQFVEGDYLFLVNGRDDDGNGFIDDGFDGIDNNHNGLVDETAEGEEEKAGPDLRKTYLGEYPYVIRRRPSPSPGGIPVTLPSGTVIDLSTWNTTRERSRLPINTYSGEVDILVNARGEVVPSTIYSTPASTPFGPPFLHFWIGDRSDVFDPDPTATPHLPTLGADSGPARSIKGTPYLVSMNARSGRIETTTLAPIKAGGMAAASSAYDPNLIFRPVEQGGR